MKKGILAALSAAVCLLVLASAAGSAGAAELTMQELLGSWEASGYPDNVGGVYAEGDGLVVMLTEQTTQAEQAILAQVSDPENVTFGYSSVSYGALQQANEQVTQKMVDGDPAIFGCGIGWGADEQGQTTGYGESGKEFRVVVQVSEEKTAAYAKDFQAEFGDLVVVEQSAGNVTFGAADAQAAPETEQPQDAAASDPTVWALRILAMCVGGGLVFWLMKARKGD